MRSRGKKIRSASPELAAATAQAPAAAAHTAANGSSAQSSRPPAGEEPAINGRSQPGAGSPVAAPSAASGRRALKNWRVRSRLLLLVAIPTLTAVILGGFRIASAAQSATTYQRVVQLANLSKQTTALVQALQNEREDMIRFIVLGTNGGRAAALSPGLAGASASPEQSLLADDYRTTAQLAGQVKQMAAGIGDSYPELAQQEAANVITAVDSLAQLHNASIHSRLPALVVTQKYDNAISQLLALDDQVAVDSNDSALVGAVRVLGLVSRMKEDVAEQQAILTSALAPDLITKGQFGASQLSAITAAEADQQSSLADFDLAASAGQRQLFDSALSGAVIGLAQAQEQQAIALASNGGGLTADPIIADASAAESYTVAGMRSVEQQLVAQIIARSTSLRNGAITAAIIGAAAVLLVLALALLFTTVVGRSMIRPLQRLRTGALEVAGVRLPEAVRRLSESEDATTGLEVAPIDVDSTDEIGEVARAFDQVHREALQLAANEAALRGNVNAMFVNLSRRSQSLVERQIRLIDDLEQGEQDAERLANLFQMDHLATRMRRNSENLLVLAGHDLSRRWHQPVAMVDVLRAAVSEIEEYERVSLNVQPGIAVRGQAVNDVVHLLAELAENATSLSSADTPVNISGHLLTSGGVLLDITDQGVGMGAEEMAHANWRLDNPPVVDVAVSRRMGLFVVGRLAARHGIRVRLRPAASGGLTALVWLPDEVITHESPTAMPGASGFDTTDPGVQRLEAELAGLGHGDWVDPDRAAAEQEVSAARTPKFTSLRADAEESPLGPRRVPGAALRTSASWGATGPLPVFQAAKEPDDGAGESPAGTDDDIAATGQGPAVGGDQADEAGAVAEQAASAGTQPVADASGQPFGSSSFDARSFDARSFDTQSLDAHQRSAAGSPPFDAPSFDAPSFDAPSFDAPSFDAPSFDAPSFDAPSFDAPSFDAPSFDAPLFGARPFGGRPAGGGSVGGEPAGGEPAGGEPVGGEPAGTEPVGGEPVGGEPVGTSHADGEAAGTAPGPGGSTQVNGKSEALGSASASLGALARYDWETGATNGEVIVPPAESLAEQNRLPIFEAVESDWFRHGRHALGWSADDAGSDDTWSSPADEGWRAAEIVPAPSSAGLTPAGLPKRVPQANLVPGSASSSQPEGPARSAAATRERFASFQRGVREARAASGGPTADGEDETS